MGTGPRRRDTRAGTIELAIPKLRQGSYFPEWLLERRRRSEQALISLVATSYLLGVSTRRVEKLAATLGISSLSKSQVSELAKSLDGAVEQFRSRPLDAGPYRFVQADAMTGRVREGGTARKTRSPVVIMRIGNTYDLRGPCLFRTQRSESAPPRNHATSTGDPGLAVRPPDSCTCSKGFNPCV